MRDLANVSEVTLFRHFDTKRNLFDETVHSCIHPYKLEEYLANNVTYDLAHDLTQIAYNMKETYQQNGPILKMIMRDKVRDSAPEMHAKHNERCAKNQLLNYFSAMQKLGRLGAEPEMAMKFFFTNITGYFMRKMFSNVHDTDEEAYFAWMLEKVISVLKA